MPSAEKGLSLNVIEQQHQRKNVGEAAADVMAQAVAAVRVLGQQAEDLQKVLRFAQRRHAEIQLSGQRLLRGKAAAVVQGAAAQICFEIA